MKKCLSFVLVMVLLLCLIPTTNVFAVKEQSISTLELTVPAPKEGAKPVYDKIDGRGYYSDNGVQGSSTRIFKNGIAWYKSASSYFSPGTTATFEGNKNYTVKINLIPKENYVFAANVTASVNGKAASVEVYDDGSILVEVDLMSASDTKTAISNVSLNVVKPVTGKTPTFAKVDTAQYFSEKYGSVSNCSNGVTWTNQGSGVNITVNNPFKEGTKYKVSYYLTAKDGYKFTSNTVATINGTNAKVSVTDATHATVSLSDLVPGDGKKEITSVDISITAPKDGEKPVYTKIDGTGYYSDNGLNGSSTKIYKNGIAWYKSASAYISPGTTETFKGGTEYTLKISLIPKDGYKFAKTVTAKINGKAVTVESFDDGSITVSGKLTALKKEHTHTDSGWKNDADNHWKSCTDASCGAITVAKTAHKDSDKDNKCDTCGYVIPESVGSTTSPSDSSQNADGTPLPSDPDGSEAVIDPTNEPQTDDGESLESDKEQVKEDNKKEENDNKDTDGNNLVILWIIIAAVVIVAGVVITILVLKKKNAGKGDESPL